MSIFRLSFITLVLLFTGCTTQSQLDTPKEFSSENKAEPKAYIEEMSVEHNAVKQKAYVQNQNEREALVQSAMCYLGKRDGKDCSGFVNLVNFQNGSPFYKEKELSSSYDNPRKSRAMYNLMKKKGDIFEKGLPRIGDLVFFEDTEQRRATPSKTKGKTPAKAPAPKVAENITHVGIVTKVDSDGTVEFIHHSNGKNILDYMNFTLPNQTKKGDKVVNTYMKRCKSKNGAPQPQCMNIAFFVAYGTYN